MTENLLSVFFGLTSELSCVGLFLQYNDLYCIMLNSNVTHLDVMVGFKLLSTARVRVRYTVGSVCLFVSTIIKLWMDHHKVINKIWIQEFYTIYSQIYIRWLKQR